MSAQRQPREFPRAPVSASAPAGLHAIPLANAVTAVAEVAYLVCAALSIIAPDILLWYFQSFLHGLSLEPLRPAGPWFEPARALFGFVAFGATIWVGTVAAASLYNTLARR